MLLIFFPVAFVASALYVSIDTESVGLVVHPAAVVDIAICMEELSLSTRLIVLPITLISGIVNPNHVSISVTQATFPLAIVDSTCAICVHLARQLCVALVRSVECLFCFVRFEIFALHLTSELHYAVLAPLDEASNQRLYPDNLHPCACNSHVS